MSITIEKARYDCSSGVSSRSAQRWANQPIQPKPTTTNQNKPTDVTYWGGTTVRGVTGATPVRNDASLVPPIRQTASIFKQPVTVYKTGGVSSQPPPAQLPASAVGNGDKPKQLIWEKRLEGLRACDASGEELGPMELPKGLKPVLGPVSEGTVVQSVATALHVCQGAVTGQTGPKSSLDKNPSVYLDPRQPLVHQISISDDDIRRQEERVALARRKLQEALNA